MANRRFIDFPIASTVNDNDIVLIWQDGLNKQTTKGTLIQGAPTSLEGLTDVDIAGLINGQILQYNSTTGKWENVDRTDINLSQLGDVSIVSPSNGQVLVYNSSTSKWENSSGGFVPYTGAVTTVDLGAQGLRAGYIRFDTTIASVPDEQGLMYWDDSRSTAALIMNGTLQHIGQDTFFYVKNSTGSNIPKGTAVRFDGTDGGSGHLLIAPFLADGTYPSSYFMGVTAEEILNGEFGQVMHFGELEGINTTAYSAGDLLYASTSVAGAFQTTAPVSPNNIVLIAAAINSKNNGAIIVRPTYGSNINQDEGVKITSVADKDLLQYQSGTGLWENKTLAQVLGGTSSQFVKGDGTLDSTAYGTGTVTSVGLSSATSGVTIGSTPITTSGTITLAIATASGSQNGLLSSTDWTTFNGKQNALTNPVTGTGTTNYLPKFTGSTTIGDSNLINSSGGNLGLGVTPSSWFSDRRGLQVQSGGSINGSASTVSFVELGANFFHGNLADTYIGSSQSTKYRQLSGFHEWYIAASGTAGNAITFTQAMTLTSGGNLLVGTTTDAGFKLDVNGTGRYNQNNTSSGNATGIRLEQAGSGDVAISYLLTGVREWLMGVDNSDSDSFKISNITGSGDFNSTGLCITTSGNVLIGTTSQLQSNERLAITTSTNTAILAQFTGGSTTGWAAKFWNNGTSGDNLIIEFLTETSITARGSVTYNRGSGVTAFNTTSDYRIKSEITDFNSLKIISNLKPKEFKIGNAPRKTIGFIAHELQEFFPQAVTGIKDQIDNFGNPIYQSVDYSQLTGLLVKAIQELKQEINTLKN